MNLPGVVDASWRRVIEGRGPALPVAVLAVNFILAVATNRFTLNDFPNVADEYANQLQARMLAEGRFSVPSPEPREFFDYVNTINDGKFYGKYSPGWPLVLSTGYILHVPWLVNPVLLVLTFALLYRTAADHFGTGVARVALLSTLANPCFVFHSATYYPHTACLFFVTVFLHGFFGALREPERKAFFFEMGVAASATFLTRSYTAVAALGPLAAWLAWDAHRSGRFRILVRQLPLLILPLAAGAAFLMYYDYSLTGDPFLQPFLKYDPWDHPKLPLTEKEIRWNVEHNFVRRLLELMVAVPLSLLFVFLYYRRPETRNDVRGSLLVAAASSTFAAYFFYAFPGFNLYGPRYLYEIMGGLVIISAMVMAGYGRMGALLLALVLVFNGGQFIQATRIHSGFIRARCLIYDEVRRAGIRDAIVFVRMPSGSMMPGDLTRNGIHFDGPVLYVRDRGAKNPELLQKYPGRKAYTWEYDPQSLTGSLIPWTPSRSGS